MGQGTNDIGQRIEDPRHGTGSNEHWDIGQGAKDREQEATAMGRETGSSLELDFSFRDL